MRQNIFNFFFISLAIVVIAGCSSAPKQIKEPIKKEIVLDVPILSPELQQQFDQAVNQMKNAQYMPAIATFRKLIGIEPRLAGAYVNMGIIMETQGEDDQARSFFEKAIEINPNNVYALNYLGLEKQKEGKFEDAETLFLQGLANNPNDERINFNIGVLYEIYLGEYKKAIKHYSRYVKVSKNSNVEKVKRWIKLLERR